MFEILNLDNNECLFYIIGEGFEWVIWFYEELIRDLFFELVVIEVVWLWGIGAKIVVVLMEYNWSKGKKFEF